MDQQYINFGTPLTKLIEECSEVIQISCKIQCFGIYNYRPNDPKRIPNYQLLKNELEDLKLQIKTIDDLLLLGSYDLIQ